MNGKPKDAPAWLVDKWFDVNIQWDKYNMALEDPRTTYSGLNDALIAAEKCQDEYNNWLFQWEQDKTWDPTIVEKPEFPYGEFPNYKELTTNWTEFYKEIW